MCHTFHNFDVDNSEEKQLLTFSMTWQEFLQFCFNCSKRIFPTLFQSILCALDFVKIISQEFSHFYFNYNGRSFCPLSQFFQNFEVHIYIGRKQFFRLYKKFSSFVLTVSQEFSELCFNLLAMTYFNKKLCLELALS